MQDSAGSDLADRKVIRGNRFYLAGMVLVNVVTLISILLCPGNAGRNAVSIADLPIFETYGFGDKLYLEFGGKLFDDYHASRVLPGFAPDSKLQMLLQLADQAEMIISINAADIERNKIRHDLGITYDQDVIRLIDVYKKKGLYVSSVVITRYAGQPSADIFQKKLEAIGIKVYHHYSIEGYPNNIDYIVSDEGYGKNDYVETTRPLVIVTAPGPGSGKMATCLSQLYHEIGRAHV